MLNGTSTCFLLLFCQIVVGYVHFFSNVVFLFVNIKYIKTNQVNVTFLYPLKSSENLYFLTFSEGIENTIGLKRLNKMLPLVSFESKIIY